MSKTFTLCFEGDLLTPKFEIEFTWDAPSVPDIVELPPNGPMRGKLVLVGRYASAGDRYWYRRATVARIQGHELVGANNAFLWRPGMNL